jgi:hypothetical protein
VYRHQFETRLVLIFLVLKTGLISQANGSGYIESGGVKIACSVYVDSSGYHCCAMVSSETP